MAITQATIQHRRGQYDDLDKQKMLPAEFAVVLSGDPDAPSGKALYLAFASGDVHRLISIEDLNEMVKQGAFKGDKGDKGDEGAPGKDGTDGVSVTGADINDSGHLILTMSDRTQIDAGLIDDALAKIEEATRAATSAAESASAAAQSEKNAEQHNTNAETWAKTAQSYATGDSGSREGEELDNAKEYARQAKASADRASEAAGGDFVTHSEVGETVAPLDESRKVPAEYIPESVGKVQGVKGEAEDAFRDGNVTIKKSDIGLGNVEDKSPTEIIGGMGEEDITRALGYGPVRSVNGATGDVEIGGTQILRGTNIASSLVSYPSSWANGTFRVSTNASIANITPISVSDAPIPDIKRGWNLLTNGDLTVCQDNVPVVVGQQYTLSFYIKNGDGRSVILQYGVNSYKAITIPIHGNDWAKVSTVFTISSEYVNPDTGTVNIYAGIRDPQQKEVQICGMKLERGNIATDWSPAPGDLLTTETKLFQKYDTTLETNSWQNDVAPYTYEIPVTGLSATQLVIVNSGGNLTKEQLEAYAEAVVDKYDQQAGKVILQALNKPQIPLPVTLLIGGEVGDYV